MRTRASSRSTRGAALEVRGVRAVLDRLRPRRRRRIRAARPEPLAARRGRLRGPAGRARRRRQRGCRGGRRRSWSSSSTSRSLPVVDIEQAILPGAPLARQPAAARRPTSAMHGDAGAGEDGGDDEALSGNVLDADRVRRGRPRRGVRGMRGRRRGALPHLVGAPDATSSRRSRWPGRRETAGSPSARARRRRSGSRDDIARDLRASAAEGPRRGRDARRRLRRQASR